MSGVVGPAARGVTSVEVDGCASLYSPLSGQVVGLNATASEVWRRCDGTRTLDDLVVEVAEAYGCAAEDVAGAVAGVVAGLREGRFLEG